MKNFHKNHVQGGNIQFIFRKGADFDASKTGIDSRLNILKLTAGVTIPKDIYDGDQLLISEGSKLTAGQIRGLENRGITELLLDPNPKVEIDAQKANQFHKAIEEINERFAHFQHVDLIAKSKEHVKEHLEKLNEEGRVNQLKEGVEDFVSSLIDNFTHRQALAFCAMAEECGGHTITHSISSLMKAYKLGQRRVERGKFTEDDLQLFLKGQFLHDVGKGPVAHLINAPRKLTDTEWDEVKKHPLYGYLLLSNNGKEACVSAIQAGMHHQTHHRKHERSYGVTHTHEDHLGISLEETFKGKEELRIKGEEFAKITMLIDVWDAKEQKRPYKRSWSTAEIVAEMNEEMHPHVEKKTFDPELYKEWHDMMLEDGILKKEDLIPLEMVLSPEEIKNT